MSKYRLAIDVGGTFTDVVAVDDDGAVSFAKVQSTPADQSVGVMRGIERMATDLGLTTALLLARTDRIVHGMTVATNALLERKGARVGLLTTEGHRDVLEMREGLKPGRYDLRMPRLEPLVPRHRRLGVCERLRADGTIHTPLDVASLDEAIDELKRLNVESVAVCYMHAYRDGQHEQLTRERIETALPGVYVSLSSEVLPQIKEFQRISTTVVNAYVGPVMKLYLSGLEQRLAQAGYSGALLIMLSHGGVGPVEEAVRIPAGTVLSGPAGGLTGALKVGAQLGAHALIGLDMGGTSTDISMVMNGEAQLSNDRSVANETIALPSLDIITLGAGGGSIGRTEAGLMKVGPQSAGAVPGPACYGAGGTQATVTDASVVLGFLDPAGFDGGNTPLNAEAARQVLDELGDTLSLEAVAAAEGVHRVVNAHMAEGIRLATVRRGVDPRGFALVGFGGAAGLHATQLARSLDINRVIIPRSASVLSAWGMLATDLRFETVRSHIGETAALIPDEIREAFASLEAAGRERMATWFDGTSRTHRVADMRYGEQIHEIPVNVDHIDFADTDLAAQLKAAFERSHDELYTYHLDDQDPVMINARVATVGELPPLADERAPAGSAEAAPLTTRKIYLGGWVNAPVYAFGSLAPGQRLAGPAVIESETTTVLLCVDDVAVTTEQGWLDIAIRGK
ncbi:MAG: hydantoinase/oxoprolinase family protein [Chromatiales bacterium]|jgi:N-methylhydantoinase A|nr:hydantoinase/oxoprolinase family protein [Chromatiales bacterium]